MGASTFDHDKRTQFPLTGGHANVGCPMCHTLQRDVQGKPVLFYKPTPKNCADCHGNNARAPRSLDGRDRPAFCPCVR